MDIYDNAFIFIRSLVRSLFTTPLSLTYIPLMPAIINLALHNQLNHDLYAYKKLFDPRGFKSTYDYIVIGAGSGGSVMASRLSEDKSVSVLLLEIGRGETVVSDVPMAAFNLQGGEMDWAYQTTSQKRACLGMINRRCNWARGRVMGGSSTINHMLYVRGNPRDYDNWAANGAKGWSWADVFPYFIKSEDQQNPDLVASGYHGIGGPLTVTDPVQPSHVAFDFQNAGPYFNYPIGDINGASQSRFTIPQRTIKNGERLSVAKAYLEKMAANRANLDILILSLATKILFDHNKRAIGVEFERLKVTHKVMARREVILCAGAINSPQILMLSGIGPKEHLNAMGIPVVSDLRVGDNLQEHYVIPMSFTVNASIGIDFFEQQSIANIVEFELFRNNSLSNTYIEGMAFVKTKYADPNDDYPDIQLAMLPATVATDFGINMRKLVGITKFVWNRVFKPYIGYNTFSINAGLMRPKTTGWIRLASKDPKEYPIIEANIFEDERDLDVLVEGMKIALAVAETPALQMFNAQPFQTVFPGCEVLDLYSEEYLRCMAQVFTATTWHTAGTCKMGSKSDPTAVVDSQLRVIGVKGLRVVDASVMPTVITGNTNAPVVMIAEKISDQMKGRKLKPFVGPMSKSMISQLPHLPYQTWSDR